MINYLVVLFIFYMPITPLTFLYNFTVQTGVSVVGSSTGEENIATASSTPFIIVAVIVALILFAIIGVMVTFYTRKIQRLKDENLTVQFDANGGSTLRSQFDSKS